MIMIFVRTVFMYLFLVLVMRLMGKRQIGELQLSELITALLLSELATAPILNNDIPLTHSVVPIVTLICLEIINTFVVTKSSLLRRFFDGTPSIIIRSGKLDRDELARVRMSLEELIAEIRLGGISDISEVDYAILEQNGRLSVFPKSDSRPPNTDELGLSFPTRGIAHALVIDGEICRTGMKLSGKNDDWLIDRLGKLGCTLSETFYFGMDDCGGEHLIRKE